ncbi:hypothetical protein FB567DRAFT_432971 [Paraphoma chrysanthemicola]|uniref:N-acetyltransferase domain-containing protein n=1 Tax=Paraphoma chrysanthemicola TaxID=798071 RepID=A0A8K0REN1_9PLEO|nr:hypothetical protein FB567DRAFT_432971 [Paraphoma chrysanthemicola]
MDSAWPVAEALPTDSNAIASLLALSWTSPFAILQFGHLEHSALVAIIAPRIADQSRLRSINFDIIRHPDTQEVLSVAQWSSHPAELHCPYEDLEEAEERQSFEDEIYRKTLPKGCNKNLIMNFTVGLRDLRRRVLHNRKHYMLENLATHTKHRRKGLASQLVNRISYKADSENALVYLDTASDNHSAISMYSRLGFMEQNRHTLEDVSTFPGAEGSESHDNPTSCPYEANNSLDLHACFDPATYFGDLDQKIENGQALEVIGPYDPTEEEPPSARVAILRPGFVKAESLIAQQVVQYLLTAISNLKRSQPSSELSHMEERTKKLLAPKYGSPVIVGVRGLAGKGKTSLINAVLSVDGLAFTSSGSVGTYVPVEYIPLGDQEAPYGFEFRMFSLEDSQKCIRMHWEDYFAGVLAGDTDEMDESDAADLVKPARDAFLALFSDLLDFESEEKADAFLSRAESVDDSKVLTKLLKWTQEKHNKLTHITRKQPFFTHTISDLADLMEPYVQTASSPHFEGCGGFGPDSSVWPLVKLGRQRVRLAETYIKRCRVTVVVDEIKRAGDNESLKQSIYEAWRRRREDSIGDEPSCKAPLLLDEEALMSTLKTHRMTMDQKIRKINSQLKEPKNRKTQSLRHSLGDEKERYERKRILIEARSRQVKSNLRTWFRDKTGLKEPLVVFCVSTTRYMDLIREDDDRTLMHLPDFTAEGTEIVALRRHLYTLIRKRGQEQSMINYYRQVKHLLNEMSLACTGFKPMYKRDHLLKFIHDTHDSFPDQCRRHRETYMKCLQPVLDIFGSSMKEWLRKAERTCDKWGNYNANSYWTFLKREGVHKRPTKNKEDWSRTLLEYAIEDLEPLLNALCTKGCSTFATELIHAFHEKMDDMDRDLRYNLDQTSIKLFSEFFDNIQLQNKAIEDLVRTVVGNLKDGLLKMSHQATSLKGKGSPFGRYMKQTYIAVMQAYPPRTGKAGVHNNRRAMFKNAVIDQASGPYLAVKQHIEVQANALLLTSNSELKKGCDEIFEKIYYNFDQICPVQEDDGFRALERGKELKKDIDEAKSILEGPAKEALLSAGIKVT